MDMSRKFTTLLIYYHHELVHLRNTDCFIHISICHLTSLSMPELYTCSTQLKITVRKSIHRRVILKQNDKYIKLKNEFEILGFTTQIAAHVEKHCDTGITDFTAWPLTIGYLQHRCLNLPSAYPKLTFRGVRVWVKLNVRLAVSWQH